MSLSNIEIEYPDTLESFEKEVKRYKPIDMIDFCSEYFECLQKGIPLRSKDLSGLKKFHLTPEDEEVVKRLKIPAEDLVRVSNRRKVKTHEEILNEINNTDYALFLDKINYFDTNYFHIYKEEDPRHEQIFKKAIGFRINHRKLYFSANGDIYLNEASSVSTPPFGNSKEMEDYRDFWNEIYKQNYLKRIRENIIA